MKSFACVGSRFAISASLARNVDVAPDSFQLNLQPLLQTYDRAADVLLRQSLACGHRPAKSKEKKGGKGQGKGKGNDKSGKAAAVSTSGTGADDSNAPGVATGKQKGKGKKSLVPFSVRRPFLDEILCKQRKAFLKRCRDKTEKAKELSIETMRELLHQWDPRLVENRAQEGFPIFPMLTELDMDVFKESVKVALTKYQMRHIAKLTRKTDLMGNGADLELFPEMEDAIDAALAAEAESLEFEPTASVIL